MAERYSILRVNRPLADVFGTTEAEKTAAASEVVGCQTGRIVRTRRVEIGIGNTEREVLGENGLLLIEPEFQIVVTRGGRYISLDTPVDQLAGLALRSGRIKKGIAAGVVVELIAAQVGIDGQQRMRVEDVLETGGDAPGENTLMLVLRELIVTVGNLDPVAGGKQVQMQGILPIGLVVEAIEDGLIVTHIVDGLKLRRIQETRAAHAVQS